MSLKTAGFSLIELMIAVAILAIIAAIAIPSYASYVDRGKRAEARAALLDIAARQERFYSNNRQYTARLGGGADSLNLPGCTATNCSSENGYYTLSVALPTGQNNQDFDATATPSGWTDDQCGNLGIDETGVKTEDGARDLDFCWGK